LTKPFERVFREPLSMLAQRLAEAPRGEAILLIEGAKEKKARTNKYAEFSKAPERD
jgi:16S rRNA (cytidine1402-2'-O)-methyltransferase